MEKSEESKTDQTYKFKDLKVYSSTEWLAGNKKKYRQVFEQNTLSYIYAELSIINKEYDGRSWEVDVQLKCFLLGAKKKEICSLEVNRTISKHDHIAYIREGWGQKDNGVFWQKGKYCWEAYVDGRKLATKYFYIEDIAGSSNLPLENSMSITNIEYFEGNYDENNTEADRTYYTEFPDFDTRYVFVELTIQNRLSNIDWYNEIFIRFYNDARELKGEVIRLQKMKKEENELQITAGWGSNVKGSWRQGKYSVEVVYQEKCIVSSSFIIGTSFKEGHTELNPIQSESKDESSDSSRSILLGPEAFDQLNELVGLRNVKRQISDHTKYIKFLQLRQDRGFNESNQLGLHSVFTGNPGTGKTTVARLLGAIYHSMGLLKNGHVHEVDRVDLVGEYIGQTAPKVKEAFEKASGGVLFIDEAYALARNNEDSKDFGREVVELLVKQMSHPSCDFMVVVAGYPQEMEAFINSNPGLNSRFKYHYDFEDFQLNELFEILTIFCKRLEVTLSASSKEALEEIVQEGYRSRDVSFGNARYIAQLVERAKINMGIRLMNKLKRQQLTDEELSMITLHDVQKIKIPEKKTTVNIAVDNELLTASLKKLDALIGLDDIKEKIHQLVDLVRYRSTKSEKITGHVNMHLVLIGNPGTGKTTVARLLADIFKALGVLEKGHMIETDRQGMVAGYVGQTAIKTANIIDQAMGGVLFIDEAYSLNKIGANNDFGDEAIQVLLKKMEDHRGAFFTIVAGYPEEMDKFLATNPGLRSRFDHHLHFPDFVQEELVSIAKSFVQDRGYRFSTEALKSLSDQLLSEYNRRDKHFGNARRVRQYVDEVIKQQSLRLGREKANLQSRYNALLKKVDVENCVAVLQKAYKHQRGTIGFK